MAKSPFPDHLQVWRAGELGSATLHTVGTGYARLDQVLPGGGWPQGALTEVLQPQAGWHEWGLVLPALAAAQAASPPCMHSGVWDGVPGDEIPNDWDQGPQDGVEGANTPKPRDPGPPGGGPTPRRLRACPPVRTWWRCVWRRHTLRLPRHEALLLQGQLAAVQAIQLRTHLHTGIGGG